MKTRFTVALSMLAGITIGAVAVQGLHAQAKPKAYIITETEVLDAAALAAYTPQVRAAIAAAGGIFPKLSASTEGCRYSATFCEVR